MEHNLIKTLGELAFGTRMRLLTERILSDGAQVYKSLNIDFEPRWFTIFYLLSRKPGLTVTGITNELSISQPAISQSVEIMLERGLLKSKIDPKDTRKKILSLSAKGERLLAELNPLWEDFEAATQELFLDIGVDVIWVLERMEKGLEEKGIYDRIMDRVKERQYDSIKILEYTPEYKNYFKELNYEWLNEYFEVEKYDRQVLSNPEKEILNKGGQILFAEFDNKIVGTTAILKRNPKQYELTKMAVKSEYRGKQIGLKLAHTVIDKVRLMKAESIILETSRKLTAATNLYTKLGFQQTDESIYKNEKFKRATIQMKLNLQN